MLPSQNQHKQTHYTSKDRDIEQLFAEPLCGAIEALLFASESPLSMDQLVALLEAQDFTAARHQVEDIVHALQEIYQQPGRGIQLLKVGGGWQFRTNPAYALMVRRLVDPSAPRFSQAALECLSIIAYRQPVTRGEIDAIRGVDSGGVMHGLRERGLVEIAGRSNAPGRPYIYQTSATFLEFFGLDQLDELPHLTSHGLSFAPPQHPSQTSPPAHATLEEPTAMQP